MTDKHITRPPYSVDRKAPSREQISGQNCIRVYNSAPGTITVQIRGTNSYHCINLTAEHSNMLIDMLNEAIADTMSPLPAAELLQIVKAEEV